jgi:hypothetical protein
VQLAVVGRNRPEYAMPYALLRLNRMKRESDLPRNGVADR